MKKASIGDTHVASGSNLRNSWIMAGLNIVGGCCGTTEKHIRALAQMVEGKKTRQRPMKRTVQCTPESKLSSRGEHAAVLVGERKTSSARDCQEPGRGRKVGRGKRDCARQVAAARHIVDVCLQSTERDEKKDIYRRFNES